MADSKPADVRFPLSLASPRIRKDPLGAVLVIGAYNFPVQLSLGPFIGAIAAGCTALLKPSEQAPATAMVLGKIVGVMDGSCYAVAQGGVPETTEILDQKWDKIFYTGGATVAKIIAKKAAETLTPVCLELGGKNPAFVTKNADLRLAARRLMWAKFHNAGQVCISQNYILVDKEMLPGLLQEIRVALQEYMPKGAKESPDYSRIATERQWLRLKGLLDSTKGKILLGGEMDQKTRFLEPTIVKVTDPNDPLIQEETFGPITSLVPVDNLEQAIRIANEVDDTPLGAYPFGNKQETDKVLAELRSGGASVNDGFFHGSIPTLQFGGVGNSGQGSYRGKASFDCFTHQRSIVKTPGWMEGQLKVRYPPYEGKLKSFQRMNNKKPNFNREGKVNFSLLGWILSLGAGSKTGGLVRYAIVLLGKIVSLPFVWIRSLMTLFSCGERKEVP